MLHIQSLKRKATSIKRRGIECWQHIPFISIRQCPSHIDCSTSRSYVWLSRAAWRGRIEGSLAHREGWTWFWSSCVPILWEWTNCNSLQLMDDPCSVSPSSLHQVCVLGGWVCYWHPQKVFCNLLSLASHCLYHPNRQANSSHIFESAKFAVVLNYKHMMAFAHLSCKLSTPSSSTEPQLLPQLHLLGQWTT